MQRSGEEFGRWRNKNGDQMNQAGDEVTEAVPFEGRSETVSVTSGPPYQAKDGAVPVLGTEFDRALIYASTAHRHQRRKPASNPYLGHLLGVASLVLEHGGSEREAIAALLHDCIEDCGAEHSTFIQEAFGDEVLKIVKACSDAEVKQGEKKPDWRERKVRYIRHLGTQPGSVLLVSGCDKLHNARAILSDLRYSGQSVWERFNKGEADQIWYYRSLADTFKARVPVVSSRLADELNRTVADIERISAELRT
jgi:(p)ppGpp synthase/HD superfamily hydrolase